MFLTSNHICPNICQNLNTGIFFDKLTIIITLDYIRLYKKKSFNITSVAYKDEYILCTKRGLKK